LLVLVIIVVLAVIGLLYWKGRQPRRVNREHTGTVAKEFEYLVRRLDFHPPWDYRLSNSGIRIHLSRMASFQSNGKLYDGNGIQPDIVVEPVPTDFIGKTDTFLETAIKYISQKNNSLHL